MTVERAVVELAGASSHGGFVTMTIEIRMRPLEIDIGPSALSVELFRASKRPRDDEMAEGGHPGGDRSVVARPSESQSSPPTSRELVPAQASTEVGLRPQNKVPEKTAIPKYLVGELTKWFVPVLSQPQVVCALNRFESAVEDAAVGKFGGTMQNLNNATARVGVTDVVFAMTGPGVIDFELLQPSEDFIQAALATTTGLRALPMVIVSDAILVHLRHKLLPEDDVPKAATRG